MPRDNMTRSVKVQSPDMPHQKGRLPLAYQMREKLWVNSWYNSLLRELM
jgi:hypothetical protein